LIQDEVLNLINWKGVWNLWDFNQGHTISLGQHSLEPVIALSPVELCYRLECIDPHLVLSALMFKREPKMLAVSV
jgi:hypothetical protein